MSKEHTGVGEGTRRALFADRLIVGRVDRVVVFDTLILQAAHGAHAAIASNLPGQFGTHAEWASAAGFQRLLCAGWTSQSPVSGKHLRVEQRGTHFNVCPSPDIAVLYSAA